MNKINKYIILYFCFTIHLKLIIELIRIIKLLIKKSIKKKRIKDNQIKLKKFIIKISAKKISKLKDKDV